MSELWNTIAVSIFAALLLIVSGVTARATMDRQARQVALTVECPQGFHTIQDGHYVACVKRDQTR